LQEVDQGTRRSGGVDQPAELAARSGFHVAFGSALDYDGGKYGVATLSRWPIGFDTLYRLPVDPPQERAGGSREPRGMLRADIASPYGTLTIFNTHIDASREDTWRRQEAGVIVSTVTTTRATRPVVFLGGDMNSTPESTVQEMVRSAGLRDAFAECGRGTGLTFPSDSAVKRIDYLYLTGTARCARAEVAATRASDHRPLVVDVLLPKM
jgi:endonuclease/exonuclease/phosphatase family metal-dependent hydrolase